MVHRARPRVHLRTGGPAWEERQGAKQPTPLKKLPKKQRAGLRQLDASMAGLKVALRHKQLVLARQLRAMAWEQVELLPRHLTRDQRQELWVQKILLRELERKVRERRGGAAQ